MILRIPPVWMSEHAFAKFQAYIDLAIGEIGGVGKVDVYTKGIFITDIYLIRQETTEVETTLDMTEYGRFMAEMLAKGEDLTKFRVWWHSHGKFAVGWSKDKDESTIARLSKKKYLISIVGNKKRQVLTRYDVQSPKPATLHRFPLKLYKTNDGPVSVPELRREVAEKVTFKHAKEVKK